MTISLPRRLAAEFLGTAFLVAAVIGSGVMGERLANGNVALALLANTIATGAAQFLSEFVATFGLISVIWGCSRSRSNVVPFAVGSYITAAYWFTSSTSFANPAVTIARALSDTFAGIRPSDVPLFIVAQLTGAIAATLLFRWLNPCLPSTARDVHVSHHN
jgi:glycerol uptake facilitator-like aquaporin